VTDLKSLLPLYDRTMRRDTSCAGLVREASAHTVRYTSPHGSVRFILWQTIANAADVDQMADAELAAAAGRAGKLIWKVYAHDAHAHDLRQALLARGFVQEEPSTLYVAHAATVAQLAAQPQCTLQVRALTHAEQLEDYLTVWRTVWPDKDNTMFVRDYQRLLAAADPGVHFWAAYDGAAPVAVGYMFTPGGSPFALLCGGATVPAARGRGAYHRLLATRARYAVSAGIEYLAVDASPDSAAIVSRLGFEPLTTLAFYEVRLQPAG
jgi:hypothetical protein